MQNNHEDQFLDANINSRYGMGSFAFGVNFDTEMKALKYFTLQKKQTQLTPIDVAGCVVILVHSYKYFGCRGSVSVF